MSEAAKNIRSGPDTSSGGDGETGGRRQVKFLVCVDNSPHSRVAVRFACLRALRTGARVVLLHVVEPADFQHWMAVGDLMSKENREEAEMVLQEIAAEVNEWAGIMPELVVREGRIGEEILAHLAEDQDVNFIMVGARPPTEGRGKLVRWLAGQLAGELHIPLTIIPGNLDDEDIRRLA